MRTPRFEAFILSAGKGTRLRPYTDTKPKPMVEVWGKPILEHSVEKLRDFGITKIIMNLHYLGDIIEKYFDTQHYPEVVFSKENDLLDTGGGVKKARHLLKNDAYFLINGDAFWTDSANDSALNRLANQWDSEKMDILILLQPVANMTLTKGIGDYDIDPQGRAIRSHDKTGQYMFGGIRIAKSNLTDTHQEDVFSFLKLMDAAQNKGTLYGLVHDADWHHISTPEDLDNVNAINPIKTKHVQ